MCREFWFKEKKTMLKNISSVMSTSKDQKSSIANNLYNNFLKHRL